MTCILIILKIQVRLKKKVSLFCKIIFLHYLIIAMYRCIVIFLGQCINTFKFCMVPSLCATICNRCNITTMFSALKVRSYFKVNAISRRLNSSELAGKIASVIIQIYALQYLVAYINLACLWRSILFMLDILT